MRALLLSALLIPALASAVPVTMSHQGRLFDDAGAPLDGTRSVTFTLYDSASGSASVWSETQEVSFTQGYFAVQLGGSAPLGTEHFEGDARFLGMKVGADSEIPARVAVTSVPFAIVADTAKNVVGGVVDATEIRVNGEVVIDGDGALAATVAWDDVQGAPADVLGTLACEADDVLVWDGSDWTCGAPSAGTFDAAALTSGTLAVDRLPVGPGAGQVAAGDHTHDAAAIASGTLALSRLPVGTDANSVASGAHTHDAAAITAGTLAKARLPTLVAADVGALATSGGTLTGGLTGTTATFSGAVRVGASTATCNNTITGTFRMSGAELELCNGIEWVRFQTYGGSDGSAQLRAGNTCNAIKTLYPGLPSGTYWIDPNGGQRTDAFQTWCDMSTASGGWTVLTNNDGVDQEPAGCYARIATSTSLVCGSAIGPGTDFAVLATGVQFREVIWATHNGSFSGVTAYQYLKWSNTQTLPASTGSWYFNADQNGQTITEWSTLPIIRCNSDQGNRIISFGNRPGYSNWGSQIATVFGSYLNTENWLMSFSEGDFASGSRYGLDDFQGGLGCSDDWSPKSERGRGSFVMVR